MRQAFLYLLSILLLVTTVEPANSKSPANDELVNVIVTLSGLSACEFLPQNYVSTHSIELDKSLEDLTKKIDQNITKFVTNNCNGMVVKLQQTYGLLTKGFACSIKRSDLDDFRKIPGVAKVTISPNYILHDNNADAPLVTGAMSAWSQKDSRGRNVTGIGQVIGVIDTGLDWRHPSLGGKLGSGAKVIAGFDYSSNSGIEKDPQTHGTQVAGVAAGNGLYKGIAPDANLIGFKVYSDKDTTGTNVGGNIIKAIEQAVTSKCTVVNLSLGSAGAKSGEEDVPEPFRNAVKAGLVVVASAGNNGARSDRIGFQVSSPSTIPQVISCAASDDTPHPVIKIMSPSSSAEVTITGTPFDNKENWPAGDYEVLDAGFGSESDFTDKDFNGKIALIMRGPVGKQGITFHDKNINAKKAGAIGCIIFNHSLSSFSGSMYPDEASINQELLPSIALSYSQGYKLKMLIPQGLKVKVMPGQTYGMICDFSSMGPSADFKFKPELSAPGQGVMTPVYMGEKPDFKNPPYKPFSGTSCASPVIAGGCALLRQMRPNDSPLVVKAKLMATANLLFNKKANEYIPLMLQGSGRMDVSSALNAMQYFNPPSASLMADNRGKQTGKAILYNDDKSQVEFTLSYWSLGRNTTCSMPEKITIPPKSKVEFEYLVQSIEGSEDILEGIIFAKSDALTIHLPLIMAMTKIGATKKVSDLRISNSILDCSESLPPTLTFKVNYGSYDENTPGRSVTSNYAACKLELSNQSESLGMLFFDDDLQVGYYNKQWNGVDFEGRLFAPDGSYEVKGIGLETIIDGSWIAISNQGDPPAIPVKVKNSPLKQKPSIGVKTIPAKPRMGEEFELRFVCSLFTNINYIKFDFSWDPNAFDVIQINSDSGLGKVDLDVELNTVLSRESGKMSTLIKTKNNKDCSGKLISIKCIPKQDGKAKFSIFNCTVDTSNGMIAPKETYDFINIDYGYSFFDLNRDGFVDELDADLLMRLYNVAITDTNYREDFDFNADGVIDFFDMAMLSKKIGLRMSPP
jgi:minor extracellular serine protease Vpr